MYVLAVKKYRNISDGTELGHGRFDIVGLEGDFSDAPELNLPQGQRRSVSSGSSIRFTRNHTDRRQSKRYTSALVRADRVWS